jgi:hypothetical protein
VLTVREANRRRCGQAHGRWSRHGLRQLGRVDDVHRTADIADLQDVATDRDLRVDDVSRYTE